MQGIRTNSLRAFVQSQDLDVDFRLQLKDDLYKKLMRQIQADAGLLERVHVMDYSLLLGIHYTDDPETKQKVASGLLVRFKHCQASLRRHSVIWCKR